MELTKALITSLISFLLVKDSGKGEPVIEIEVESKQVSEREIVSVESREEVVSVEGPSSRELYYCRKNIYEMLLKAGDKGVTLHEIMESISYSPETIRKSLSRLERESLIKKIRR
jgi:hypothetical protein